MTSFRRDAVVRIGAEPLPPGLVALVLPAAAWSLRGAMIEFVYPKPTRALSGRRCDLAPEIDAAFRQFSQAVFRDGALSKKAKQLIAVTVAHVTQSPYCIESHTKVAARVGATPEDSEQVPKFDPFRLLTLNPSIEQESRAVLAPGGLGGNCSPDKAKTGWLTDS